MAGGLYHVFSRGHDREAIYSGDGDYRHFLELVEEMRERFRVRVYAYCLMRNHYHLLVKTSEANVSAAVQWVNGSYATWYNRRHGRSGHLFGERFKAVLVEKEAWGLQVSQYLHLNPVMTESQGWGKRERNARSAGLGRALTAEELTRILGDLRGHGWSSYPAYAGYARTPDRLDCAVLVKGQAGRVRIVGASRSGFGRGAMRGSGAACDGG